MWWDLPRFFTLPFLFILGCCVGSFLNVCIHRFPAHARLADQLRSLQSHRSGCPRCFASIQWRDNIPLIGWLLLRGRCRSCRNSISWRYPLVEFLTGAMFVAVYALEMPPNFWRSPEEFGLYWPEGPQRVTLWTPAVWLHVRYALHIGMLCSLIVATFIDFELKVIPDGCTAPMTVASLIVSTVCGQCWIVPLWFQDESVVRILKPMMPDWLQPAMFSWDSLPFAIAHPHWHGLVVSLAGLVIGGGTVWLVRVVGVLTLRQEAMGFGDVTLMAMVGSVIGWQPVVAVFFIAPVLGIFAAMSSWLLRRSNEFPYGPWLSLATVALLCGWPWLWPFAERVFDMGPLVPLMAVAMTLTLGGSLQLVRVVKRIVGVAPLDYELGLQDLEEIRWLFRKLGLHVADRPADSGEWTSADHLMYYNSERPDQLTGHWSRDQWPGLRAGQGKAVYHSWRHGR